MKQFKARAERMSDIKRFMHSYLSPMQIDIISINPVGGESQFPDREVTFASKNESLEDVKTRMNRIPDLHCMFETVQLIDDDVCEEIHERNQKQGSGSKGDLGWAGHLRRLDRMDSSYHN